MILFSRPGILIDWVRFWAPVGRISPSKAYLDDRLFRAVLPLYDGLSLAVPLGQGG